MTDYKDEFFTVPDGLKLHYRDYDLAGPDAPLVLCMPGLTRNARDFAGIADHIKHRARVICVEQRGRGMSDYDNDWSRYRPDVYVGDMRTLMTHLGAESLHVIGTSLGGLMTMLLESMHPGSVKSAIINDIGPKIEQIGIERIMGYVGGNPQPMADWDAAVAAVQRIAGDVYPHYDAAAWKQFASQLFRQNDDGTLSLDYDPALAKNFKGNTAEAAPELWPIFPALEKAPLLVIRGALSDLISDETVKRMEKEHPNCTGITVPDVGHTPQLTEPECLEAITAFADSHWH